MTKLERFVNEYQALLPVLSRRDYLGLLSATVLNSHKIFSTGKLSTLDSAMSRNLCVTYRGRDVNIPVADIDRILRQHNDSPTFGNVREIFARDCYLRNLRINAPSCVLDLGANRGVFSIMALVALQAKLVIGVEPQAVYLPAFERLLAANQCTSDRAPRTRGSSRVQRLRKPIPSTLFRFQRFNENRTSRGSVSSKWT